MSAPGRQLDASVGKVMGLANIRQGCDCGYIKAPNYSYGKCSELPYFSTNISDAWSLLEGNTQWCAYKIEFDRNDQIKCELWAGYNYNDWFRAYGDTVEHAICLAILKTDMKK